jgi:hypothetical protein
MSFLVTSRWGGDVSRPTTDQMRKTPEELDTVDNEHPCVPLTHESEWCLGAYPNGLLVWENLERGGPRHMNAVPRERVLDLWIKLSQGNIGDIDDEQWLAGYQDKV